MKKIMFILLWLLFCNFSCEKQEENQYKEGLIIYMPPPDNCNDFVVEIDKTIYYPEELNDSFKKDSLRVKLIYDELDKYHNCGFGGSVKIIQISKIIKL